MCFCWGESADDACLTDGCGIAFEYVGQLKEEQELRDDEKRAPPVQNVTYASYGPTTVAPYPFTSAPNAGGQL